MISWSCLHWVGGTTKDTKGSNGPDRMRRPQLPENSGDLRRRCREGQGGSSALSVEDESLDGVGEPLLVAVVRPPDGLGEDLGDLGAAEHQKGGGRIVTAEA